MEAEGRIIGDVKEQVGMGLEYMGEQLGARSIMKTRPKYCKDHNETMLTLKLI